MKKFDFIGFIDWCTNTKNISRNEAIENLKLYCRDYNKYHNDNTCELRTLYYYSYGVSSGKHCVQDFLDFINSLNDNSFIYYQNDIKKERENLIKSSIENENNIDFIKILIKKIIHVFDKFDKMMMGYEVINKNTFETIMIVDLINFNSFISDLSDDEIKTMDNESFLLYMSEKD